MKVCSKCGNTIWFVRMANSGRWSSSVPGANKCSHVPKKES